MNRIMITASNTMGQLQKQLDVISHNIANIQTNGYKREQVRFSEMMYQQFNNQRDESKEIGRLTPHGVRQGVGAKISQIQTDSSVGNIVQTDRLLDFALTKENQYFKVLVPQDGELTVKYTRDGAFYLSPMNDGQNMLVTSQGYPVLDENDNPIVFQGDMKEIGMSEDGIIHYTNDVGEETNVPLGIVLAENPQIFLQNGDNLLSLPDHLEEGDVLIHLTGENRQQIGIRQGALEQSNVDLTEEMTNMIQTQRAYQFQARAVTLADQMQGLINGIR
ncbi:flagellar hook-basal body protein [Fervidibacillus halotolerans]|uniref:Flagellar hook-basal body protein n=1 Tax=Fervidibacillus halotolerans TaxID=2980027 RepID=A0A9E8RYE5_9BACI|nr:flagellar hook-basal body protein [Fervidibacillus halotolerans]WAA12153.1 flagellar hook-basal body protein [Fervidibacillus halotolerans]